MERDRLHVLVVDDDEDDLFLTADCLSKVDAFEIIVDKEQSYKKALHRIVWEHHDIYLIDYILGPHTGIDLIHECTSAGINKPFILLTGKGDRKVDLEAALAGAYDYLTKSEIKPELLERSLRYSMQRASALKAMAESEKRYHDIFLKSNDIIFILDKKFHIANCNPMMSTLLEYAPEELLNQPITGLFIKPRDAKRFIYHLKRQGHKNDIEIDLRTKSGLRKIFLASCANVISTDGEEQYQSILCDYTNIKKSYADQLLKGKIETTERLVLGMAHEIRNPLTAINLALYQLEKEISGDARELTEIIKRNSDRINEMITELMSLSSPVNKIEERIELTPLLKSILLAAIDRIKLKGAVLSEKYHDQPIYLIADVRKLQIALLNIIINSIEAMQDGRGRLTLETVQSGDMVEIKIGDNGVGIPAENLSHLFQPYYTSKKNGIGLGLSVAHSLIQAHGGSIEVDSTPGMGSLFTVKLKSASFGNSQQLAQLPSQSAA